MSVKRVQTSRPRRRGSFPQVLFRSEGADGDAVLKVLGGPSLQRGGAAVVETLLLLGAGNTDDVVCFDEHWRRCDCFFHAVVEQRRLLLVVGGVVNGSELLQWQDKPPC